ncbi:MAG: AmmeMemoRadiSam system protein B, partial [Dehalococcoidia bacterium]
MPGIVYGCITPHPPIMLSQIGRGRESQVSASIEAMGQICRELSQQQLDAALIISPHGTVYPDAMGVLTASHCWGTMAHWGAEGVDYTFDNDLDIVSAIQEGAKEAGMPLTSLSQSHYELDHGVMVPAYFLIDVLKSLPLVPLSFSLLPLETHLEFGKALARAAEGAGKRIALIASGDLSHRLLPEAPAGFDPIGQVFDNEITKAVESFNSQAIVGMDQELILRAGECGLRSIVILMGALDGLKVKPKVLAYEGPFGVGYLTASLPVEELALSEKSDSAHAESLAEGEAMESGDHPLVRLARDAVEQFVRTGDVKEPPVGFSVEMRAQAG